VPVGVAEIDAALVAGPAADRDAVSLQLGLEALIAAALDIESEMVEVVAAARRRIIRAA
jgi:hypothetical protein